MSIETSTLTNLKPILEFKSSAFNIPALILNNSTLAEIKQELQKKIAKAPDFFKNSPLLIDLHGLTEQQIDIDLRSLVKTLRSLKFIPIAVSGASEQQKTVAVELGIAIQSVYSLSAMEKNNPEPSVPPPPVEVAEDVFEEVSFEEMAQEEPVIAPVVENKLITQPVRSGQRIYAKGDLTVLAPVSSSAELIAEGNIHVYAPLRGRALAGVKGDTNCSIFCSDLQAELVSIAGVYRLNEDLDKNLKNTLVQIYLHDQALVIKKL